jgi:hypothetical protein
MVQEQIAKIERERDTAPTPARRPSASVISCCN